MSIAVQGITKSFGRFTALSDVSLEIPTGELVALLGPSGSGKTTLLRIIAGLERPDRGRVFFDRLEITARSVPERGVGFVFQHYALFRHMTIFENVAFSLRVRPPNARPSEAEIRSRVHELLRLVQLDWLADRYPSQLSGGQRQRVALARALAVKPKVLLLDEPFGSLDAKVRQELRRWLRRLHDEIHVTSVFVTHDQEEAMEVADRIVVINEGRVIQTGTPEEVYDHPATPFVYQFLGNINRLRGRIQKGRLRVGGAEIKPPDDLKTKKGAVVVYVRPHEIELARATRSPAAIETTVREVYAVGPTARLELALKTGGDRIEAVLTKERYKKLSPRMGDRLFVTLRNIRIFPGNAAP